MKVFDLVCDEGHRFEGWFASADAYAAQRDERRIACPLCDSHAIERAPSAPRLHLAAAAPSGGGEDLGRRLFDKLREVVASTEDVGARFAEEARRIHYRETPARAIRGTATDSEHVALRDEGIETVRLPIPRALTETLQ